MSGREPAYPGTLQGHVRTRGPALWPVVVAALVVAAVVGLLAGAVWGLSSRGSTTGSLTPAPGPGTSMTGPSTGPTSSRATSPTPTSPSEATPSGTTGFPPAPSTNQLVTQLWRLSPWRVTNANGVLGVTGTLRNLAATPRSATLTVLVYAAGQPVGQATTTISDWPGTTSAPVVLSSVDRWQPGAKILVLEVD